MKKHCKNSRKFISFPISLPKVIIKKGEEIIVPFERLINSIDKEMEKKK